MADLLRYVRRLDRALVVEATRQTCALWGEGRSQADHTAHVFEQLDKAGPELLRYVGLVERGRLPVSMKRYSLLLRDGGGPVVRAVGIGAVFTRPSARGRGLAKQLVVRVMEEAKALGYAAAVLYSDIDPAFYEPLGFVPLASRDFVIDVDALPTKGALEVRQARERDLEAVLTWHEAAWREGHPRVLRSVRSPALFRFFSWRNRARAWIVRARGRDVGVILAGPDDEQRDLPHPREPGLFWFDEAAAPGIAPERLWATVRVLATTSRAKRVRGWLGPDGVPDGARSVARPAASGMIASLSPELVVRPKRAWLDSFLHY